MLKSSAITRRVEDLIAWTPYGVQSSGEFLDWLWAKAVSPLNIIKPNAKPMALLSPFWFMIFLPIPCSHFATDESVTSGIVNKRLSGVEARSPLSPRCPRARSRYACFSIANNPMKPFREFCQRPMNLKLAPTAIRVALIFYLPFSSSPITFQKHNL